MNKNLQQYNRARKFLGIAGLVPFIALPILHTIGFNNINFQSQNEFVIKFNMLNAFIAYSAIILSFLAGSIWGKSISIDGTKPNNFLILLSNCLSIGAWLCLVLINSQHERILLTLLLLGFVTLLLAEHFNKRKLYGARAKAYLRLRTSLTGIVALCHIAFLSMA